MTILNFLFNNNSYLEDLITRSTFHSNSIEGNTLTYAETYAILFNDNSFTIQGKKPREIYEAINHKEALKIVFDFLQASNQVDDRFIKLLNETINKNINDTLGYRKVQVFIQGSDCVPPAPEKLPNLMNYFVYNYNEENINIYEKIAKYHIEFEKIHPFEDGNGRTGRLLLNYELLKNNLPPVIISNDDRVKYFEFIRNNDISNFSNWLQDLSKIEHDRLKTFGYIDN